MAGLFIEPLRPKPRAGTNPTGRMAAPTPRRVWDIVSVASAFTSLRRVGRQQAGPCPIHGNQSPTFYVHPGKQVFYCHSCGAGGDAVTLVRVVRAMTYREAVSWLEDRGFPLAVADSAPARPALPPPNEWYAAARQAERYLELFEGEDPLLDEKAWEVLRQYRERDSLEAPAPFSPVGVPAEGGEVERA